MGFLNLAILANHLSLKFQGFSMDEFHIEEFLPLLISNLIIIAVFLFFLVNNTNTATQVEAITTNGAIDWEFFTLDGIDYLALACHTSNATSNVDSYIYKWDATNNKVIPVQTIATNGAGDWEFFTSGGRNYLAVTNRTNTSSRQINSRVYWLQMK